MHNSIEFVTFVSKRESVIITNFLIFGTFFYMRPETDRITVRMEISGHSNFNHHKEGGNGKIVGNLPLDLFQQNC